MRQPAYCHHLSTPTYTLHEQRQTFQTDLLPSFRPCIIRCKNPRASLSPFFAKQNETKTQTNKQTKAARGSTSLGLVLHYKNSAITFYPFRLSFTPPVAKVGCEDRERRDAWRREMAFLKKAREEVSLTRLTMPRDAPLDLCACQRLGMHARDCTLHTCNARPRNGKFCRRATDKCTLWWGHCWTGPGVEGLLNGVLDELSVTRGCCLALDMIRQWASSRSMALLGYLATTTVIPKGFESGARWRLGIHCPPIVYPTG